MATDSSTDNTAVSRAKAFLAQERFHRRCTVPATEAHGELTVTYAVAGVDSESAPTLLFVGGLYGGRLFASLADELAKSQGVRMVVADRPDMGGSTAVPAAQRLQVWLETVPVLLHAVGAQHVTLAAHSCGAIYALNTLYQMPWILPATNRQVFLFSPWVGVDNGGAAALAIASLLPSSLVDSLDHVVRFMQTTMSRAMTISGGLSSGSLSGASSGSSSEAAALNKEMLRVMFSESTRGAGHEALLCLHKDSAAGWGVCDDYGAYPGALETKLKTMGRSNASDITEGIQISPADTTMAASDPGPISFHTFWAESDAMIAKKGEAYFDKCFAQFDTTRTPDSTPGSSAEEPPLILYDSKVIPGTTHDTICTAQHEPLARAMRGALGEGNGQENKTS